MNTFFLFVTILAWTSIVLSVLLIGIRIHGAINYPKSVQRIQDLLAGQQRIFPVKVPFAILLLSIVWLVARYNGVN
jgi:hypothetical protein